MDIVDGADTHIGYFKRPDFATIKAITKVAKTDEVEAGKVMFNNCWLGGSEELKEDAQQFTPPVWDSMTGNHGASGTATWRQMLDNGFVHDTDGFLLDGENACWS